MPWVMPFAPKIRKPADRLIPPLDARRPSAYNARHAHGICDLSANYRPGALILPMDRRAAGKRRMDRRAAPIFIVNSLTEGRPR
ncbi:hypothetical protein ACFQ3C_04760 [Seohaeicola saemankumensis]|uniref:Uncharacterized protein n=1 Tax=Seohaeicola saemankumensis TaxID=481181 RepID=A0ABW3TAL8_9RHOB